jgi:hypothetical protein
MANRVARTLKITNMSDWKHVTTLENPADLISQGLTQEMLMNGRVHSSFNIQPLHGLL